MKKNVSSKNKLKIVIDESHKERTAHDHFQELKEKLKAYGKLSIRTKTPLTSSLLRGKDLLLIGGPEHPWIFGRGGDKWDQKEVRVIERFVSTGGALLMMGDGLASAEEMSKVTESFGITFGSDLIKDVIVSSENITSHSITKEVNRISLGSFLGSGGNYLKVEYPALVLVEHEDRPIMAYAECDGGRVVVLSNLSLFSNEFIEIEDNLTLLENIITFLTSTVAETEEISDAEKEPAEKGDLLVEPPPLPSTKIVVKGSKPEEVVEQKAEKPIAEVPIKPKKEEVITEEPLEIELVHPVSEHKIWLQVDPEDKGEGIELSFNFTDHIQQFRHGIPPISYEEGTVEYVRGLRQPGDDPWTCDLPFTEAEPWSPANYLRRFLYHLTHGRISFFMDKEIADRLNPYVSYSWSAAEIAEKYKPFENQMPLQFSDGQIMGRWYPIRFVTSHSSSGLAGVLYLSKQRFLFQSMISFIGDEDESNQDILPFLSFWNKVDFSTLLRAFGERGIPILVERNRGVLPDQIAPQMWFKPIKSWKKENNLDIIHIKSLEMNFNFVKGSSRRKGKDFPAENDGWCYFGYTVTKTNGRKEFVAMMPPFIVGANDKETIESDFKITKNQWADAIDALDLIASVKFARDHGLLHEVDEVSKSVPLQEAPYPL